MKKYDWDTEKAIKMYQDGCSQREIGRAVGVHHSVIGNHMKEHNITNPKPFKRRVITIDMVKEEFENRGYKLITTKYKNSHQKLQYICSKHKDIGIQEIAYYNFHQGKGCPYCAGVAKLTYEEVKRSFVERGYKLVSTEYINNREKLKYICPKHEDKGILEIRYDSFQQGHGCKYCAEVAKHTIEDIKNEFNAKGYKLVSEEYKGNHEKLQFICKIHKSEGIQEKTYASFQQGHECKYCGYERIKNLGTYTPMMAEENKEEFSNTKAILYIIKCFNSEEQFYKIGVTKRTMEERFSCNTALPYNYKSLKEIKTNLYDAIYLEEKLHNYHKKYLYSPKIEFGGHTECFSQINIEAIKEIAS